MADDVLSPEDALPSQLRRWRERRGLTAQQLADRVAKLGGDLSRQAISRIENGDRRVTLDELAVLGYALDIPPGLLAFPLGVHQLVRIAGRDLPVWQVMKWWIGEVGIEGGDEAGASIIGYFRDHDVLLGTVTYNRNAGTGLAESWEGRLRDLRKNMLRAGVVPPDLPEDLADIDARYVALAPEEAASRPSGSIRPVDLRTDAALRRPRQEGGERG